MATDAGADDGRIERKGIEERKTVQRSVGRRDPCSQSRQSGAE